MDDKYLNKLIEQADSIDSLQTYKKWIATIEEYLGSLDPTLLEKLKKLTKSQKKPYIIVGRVKGFLMSLASSRYQTNPLLPLNNPEESRERRLKFLYQLYKATHGNGLIDVNTLELGTELGYSPQETSDIDDYLFAEGLIDRPAFSRINITHPGIVVIENAITEPEKSTRDFPPLTVINIAHMEGSQIQQGNITDNQTIKVNESTERNKHNELKVALIGLLGVIISGILIYSGAIAPTKLSIKATQTAEALGTLNHLQTITSYIPTFTILPTTTNTITPSPTQERDVVIGLVQNFYECINTARAVADYDICWNLLSDRNGEFQANLPGGYPGFLDFWRQWKVSADLYYCAVNLVTAKLQYYNSKDTSKPSHPDQFVIIEYTLARDDSGWRIKSGLVVSALRASCGSKPLVTILP